MNYTLTPSLNHTAKIKIATELWKLDDIQGEGIQLFQSHQGHYQSYERRKQWGTIEEQVCKKLDQIPLPDSFKKEILSIIQLIGLEIFKWVEYYDENLFSKSNYYAVNYIKNLCWTAQGIIDQNKTAELLLHNQSLDAHYSYKLACLYCCDAYIRILWNQLPESSKSFYNKINNIYGNYQHLLIAFWTCYITNDMAKLDNIIKQYNSNNTSLEYIFQQSVKHGHKTRVQYFWERLSNEEKSSNVIKFTIVAINSGYTEIICYLLSQIDEEQQMLVFQNYSYLTLKHFLLDWKYQDLFLPTAKHVLKFLSEENYTHLLSTVVDKMRENFQTDDKYQNIFKELWNQGPSNLKQHIIKNIWVLLSPLFKIENIKAIELILDSISFEKKKQIIYSYEGKRQCTDLIYKNQWGLLEVFIKKALMSAKEIRDFKKELGNSEGLLSCSTNLICKDKRHLVEEFLNWCFASEEEVNNFKKKLANNVMLKLINKDQLQVIDKFLNWCFASKEEGNNFKKEFLYKEENICINLICNFISENNWHLVDQFLNWCLLSNKELDDFKKNLSYRKAGEKCINLIAELISKGDEWQLVEKFFNWCFSSEDEINKFKEKILISKNGVQTICLSLIYQDKLKSADIFLEWCFSSEDKINKFKRELVLSFEATEMLKNLIDKSEEGDEENEDSLGKWALIKRIIEWYNPSEEMSIELKKECWSYEDEEELDKGDHTFFNLLDNFIQGKKSKELQELSQQSEQQPLENSNFYNLLDRSEPSKLKNPLKRLASQRLDLDNEEPQNKKILEIVNEEEHLIQLSGDIDG